MRPKIVKLQAFGGDWFMFYCGCCGRTIDCGIHPEKCASCKAVIEWPKKNKESVKTSHNSQSSKNNSWRCDRCKQEVDGSNVTFEETRDGCGGNCY